MDTLDDTDDVASKYIYKSLIYVSFFNKHESLIVFTISNAHTQRTCDRNKTMLTGIKNHNKLKYLVWWGTFVLQAIDLQFQEIHRYLKVHRAAVIPSESKIQVLSGIYGVLPLILIVLGEFGAIEEDGELTVEDRDTISKNTWRVFSPIVQKPRPADNLRKY